MGKQTFDRTKKTLGILLAVCFLISVTAALVSASNKDYEDGYKDGYKQGYKEGYKKGYAAGTKTAEEVQAEYKSGVGGWGHSGFSGTDYGNGFNEGYKVGYKQGYSGGFKAGSQEVTSD
jgi:flagellar biosynthesis/type III secretory pathway protein FliH